MSAKVFINYRRDDSAPYAVSIAQYLENAFGKDSVFIDVDWLRPGQSFPDVLNERLRDCKVMLVLVGPRWLATADGATGRRLDNRNDWVRIEILAALAQGLRVIPVLVGGACFPDVTDLPVELRPLADRHHVTLTTNGFRYEMAGLVKDIAPLTARAKARRRSRWSIVGVAFRLSIVVGILAGAWSYFEMHMRYFESVGESRSIHWALLCAQYHSDEVLIRFADQYGVIDISKVGCGNRKPFNARLDEIRKANKDFDPGPQVNYRQYVDPVTAVAAGILVMLSVIGLGLLLAFVRRLAIWIIGIKPA